MAVVQGFFFFLFFFFYFYTVADFAKKGDVMNLSCLLVKSERDALVYNTCHPGLGHMMKF